MQSGDMDARITLRQRAVARDAFGGEQVTWSEWARPWAKRVELSGREYLAAKQVTPEVVRKYVILWRPGVTESMTVEADGQVWDIQRLQEIGRRQWLEITVKVPTNG